MELSALNDFSRRLDARARAIQAALSPIGKCTLGYFNGHYRRGAAGAWKKEFSPILPQGRLDAPFEVYGVEDDLTDLYLPGEPWEALAARLRDSGEREVFFPSPSLWKRLRRRWPPWPGVWRKRASTIK